MIIADMANLPELLALLSETTLAASAALLLVLLVRRPLRNAFGAAVAYASWALVPAAVIAVLLPAATVAVESAPVAVTFGAAAPMASVQVAASIDVAAWLFALWLAGVVLMVLNLGRQQRAFRRGLGCLQSRADGLQQAESVAGLPAALGLLHPRIVVPSDFDTRYSLEERQLMHAHERNHIVRGDLHINALVAALRCVFWFNPLLHYATRHFRHDQELACDQRVIAGNPHARRTYGEAMFKIQLAAQQPLALGCHWGYSHPLKERIAMLKQPVPSLSRWMLGSAVVAALALGGGFAAWAAQPARPALAAPALPPTPAIPATPASAPIPVRTETAPVSLPSPVSAPGVIVNRTPPPAYPAEALAKRIGGKVVLVIDIDPQGKPVHVEVEQSEPAGVFDQGAIEAAMKWQFAPAIENGKAVPARVQVPVEFKPSTVRQSGTPASNVIPSAAPRPHPAASPLTTVGQYPEVMASQQPQPAPLPASPTMSRLTPPPAARPSAQSGRPDSRLDPAEMVAPMSTSWDAPAKLVSGKSPVYPISQALSGKSGSAVIVYTIGTDGRPRDIDVETATDERYANHAVIALRNWLFQPATKTGVRVESRVRQSFFYDAAGWTQTAEAPKADQSN